MMRVEAHRGAATAPQPMSDPAAHTCSKTFSGYPCCHRQWRHPGHCRFVHGYSRSFTLWFRAHRLDAHGFVVDFSSLRELERRLASQFDHTFLANADDPLLSTWQALHDQGALDLRVMTNVGMEASAELVWSWANELLRTREGARACCWKAEARENERNAACFEAVPEWFAGGGADPGDLPWEAP
jgi:6-pyruvoyltetrahydropterin/6-carboxytetrahydropterin synthase